MPPPPPPPPPPPILNDLPSKPLALLPTATADRNALLSQIQKGTNLKKATTNDRSSPLVNGKSPTPSVKTCSDNSSSIGRKPFSGGPVGLGDLFAQGVPKLKPTNKSFLDGGAYKSQLSPRSTINKSGLNSGTAFSKARENVNSHFAQQNLPQSVDVKSHKQRKEPEANIKNSRSLENIISDNVNQISLPVIELAKSNSGDIITRGPLPPPPPSATKKPAFNTIPSRKPNVIRSYLHENDDPSPHSSPVTPERARFTSDPERVRSSSRPLPMPKNVLVNNCPLVKSIGNLKPKSYDDTDIPSNYRERDEPEKSLEFSRGLKSAQNSSIPSNLNKLQNGSTQPRPLRQKKRHLVKPTSAPPPLPTWALEQQSRGGSLNDVRPNVRELPPVPSSGYQSSTLPRPPPPPPRVQSQSCTMDRKRVPPPPPVPKIQLPPGEKVEPVHQSAITGSSSFENRFASMYRNISELPRPTAFSNRSKTYPSKIAKANSTSRRQKARQPPPPAPPPPPPPLPIG